MSELSKTFSDFFGPADEANRTELDASIRQAELDRKQKEANDFALAKKIQAQYHSDKPIKLTNEQIDLLIEWGLAYMTATTESEYGRLVVKEEAN